MNFTEDHCNNFKTAMGDCGGINIGDITVLEVIEQCRVLINSGEINQEWDKDDIFQWISSCIKGLKIMQESEHDGDCSDLLDAGGC